MIGTLKCLGVRCAGTCNSLYLVVLALLIGNDSSVFLIHDLDTFEEDRLVILQNVPPMALSEVTPG